MLISKKLKNNNFNISN